MKKIFAVRTIMERWQKKPLELQAGFTVEAAAIFPVIFLVWILSVYMLFYYHDKMILTGTVYETAAVGSEKMRLLKKPQAEELEEYFQERLRGKMIFFAGSTVRVTISGKEISVEAEAFRKRMHLAVRGSMKVTEPESYLRIGKRLKEAGEEYGSGL
ncbi:MAG TPA: pilus assembly protein [Lachnospiraceae bacterium]|nr:pilus assembly protein [Lachnospiraceae bacterium]